MFDWDFIWAGLLGGTVVAVTQAIIEGIRFFGGFQQRTFIGLIINLVVSAISGIVALAIVSATGLLDGSKDIKI